MLASFLSFSTSQVIMGLALCASTAAWSRYLPSQSPVSVAALRRPGVPERKSPAYVSQTTIKGFSVPPVRNHRYCKTPGSFSCTYSQILRAISSTCEGQVVVSKLDSVRCPSLFAAYPSNPVRLGMEQSYKVERHPGVLAEVLQQTSDFMTWRGAGHWKEQFVLYIPRPREGLQEYM
jgi:hypothetical protein